MSNILKSKSIDVNFNDYTFNMVDGLTINDIKIKYNWILNADIRNAIIGKDENGIVWYSGEWLDGVWESGTWYNGTWYKGRWKKGDFYSKVVDTNEAKYGRNIIIKEDDITQSKFLGGHFEDGTFHYGIFGHTRTTEPIPSNIYLDFILYKSADYTLIDDNYIDEFDQYVQDSLYTFNCPSFDNGQFINGWMNASKFVNGEFHDGFISNSIWYNGILHKGIILGDKWYNGTFKNGIYSNGEWYDGTLLSSDINNLTIFGKDYNYLTSGITISTKDLTKTYYKTTGCTWYNGNFINGIFQSGINTIDNSLESYDHSKSKWYNGTFHNGFWYGGTFNNGNWKDGFFYNGVINNIYWNNGTLYNCFCNNGTFINGTFKGGIFNNTTLEYGNIGI